MAMTGRKVAIITVSAFTVIVAVNITMAVLAVGTFPGLEVKNSYVASQKFDDDRAAQEALGWSLDAGVEGDVLSVALTDRAGHPVSVDSLDVTMARPTHKRDDFAPDMTYFDGVFSAPVDLSPGKWNIHVAATAPDGTPFRQTLGIFVN